MKMTRLVLAALMMVGAFAYTAQASDGPLAATSSATSTVELTIPAMVQITGMQDNIGVSWPATAGTGVTMAAADATICVFSNTFAADDQGEYKITVDATASTHTGDNLHVTNGTQTIVYTFDWFDAASTAGTNYTITAGGTRTGLTNGDTDLTACASNSAMRVSFSGANVLNDRPAGTYTGRLVLLVEPD